MEFNYSNSYEAFTAEVSSFYSFKRIVRLSDKQLSGVDFSGRLYATGLQGQVWCPFHTQRTAIDSYNSDLIFAVYGRLM